MPTDNEIRETVIAEAERLLEKHMDEVGPHGAVGVVIPEEIMVDPVIETARYLIREALSIRGNVVNGKFISDEEGRYSLEVVDREAELPFPGEGVFARLNYQVDLMSPVRGSVIEAYRMAQQDVSEAGFAKVMRR